MVSVKFRASQPRSIYQYRDLRIKVLKCCADIFFNRQCLTKKIVLNYADTRCFIIHYFNFYCKRNGIPLSATLLYLKIVLYWPEDNRLRSKHVATMWPDCICVITVMMYCCVVTVYNTLYTFVNTQRDGFCQIHVLFATTHSHEDCKGTLKSHYSVQSYIRN